MTVPFSRRDVLRGGRDLATLITLSTLAGDETPLLQIAAAQAPAHGGDVYRAIGVKPLINGRGTFTIISGSLMLPEVRAAMDAAARHYVHLDELTDAIGARLAELTGAEWGLVTSGCSAAITHATAACVAGGNPDLHVRIPDLNGFREGRSHHPETFPQRLRCRRPCRRRPRRRGDNGRRARGCARSANCDDLRARRAERRLERR